MAVSRIENVVFELGQRVCLVLNPAVKAQVIAVLDYVGGSRHYRCSYVDSDGIIKDGYFYGCELEADTE